jgi:hypothetical protein
MRRLLTFAAVLAVAVYGQAKPKTHTVAVGRGHLVSWTIGEAAEQRSLMVRPLVVDERRKEWVMGEPHDVTDHSFVILQVQQINDAQPSEKVPHFIWQTGSWLQVERNTGHITVLRLAGYDPALSGISWFRDYAAYCALAPQARALYAEIVELGQHKPAARKKVSAWPLPPLPAPAPPPAEAAPAPEPDPQQPTLRSGPAVGLHHGPARRVPSIVQQMNTGAPHPIACNQIEWMRDPLRANITPRADLPQVTLDLSSIPAADPTPAPSSQP